MPFIYAFLPLLCCQVSWLIIQLRKENQELRSRLDALEGKTTGEVTPENRAVNPV